MDQNSLCRKTERLISGPLAARASGAVGLVRIKKILISMKVRLMNDMMLMSTDALAEYSHEGLVPSDREQELADYEGGDAASEAGAAHRDTARETTVAEEPLRGQTHEEWRSDARANARDHALRQDHGPKRVGETGAESAQPAHEGGEVEDTLESETIAEASGNERNTGKELRSATDDGKRRTYKALRRARKTDNSGWGCGVDVLDVVLLEHAKVHTPAVGQRAHRRAARNHDPAVSAIRVGVHLLFVGIAALLAAIAVSYRALFPKSLHLALSLDNPLDVKRRQLAIVVLFEDGRVRIPEGSESRPPHARGTLAATL